GDDVEITVKGGGLKVALGQWLKQGDVFAIAEISQHGGERRSARVPDALLQVVEEPKSAICHCRLYHRTRQPLAAESGVAGYRCLKLGTGESHPRFLVLAADRRGTPLNGLSVKVRAAGAPAKDDESVSTGNGATEPTRKSYRHLALVQVW